MTRQIDSNKRPWTGQTSGTPAMHRMLIKLLRHVPLRLVYGFADVFVVPFYMLFGRQGYISQYRFARNLLHYGAFKAWRHVYRNHCQFAHTLLDKFYMYGGGHFDFVIDNYELYQNLASQPGGFIILSAHVGNYEIAGYTLQAKLKRFNALVYGGEVETVMRNRKRLLEENDIHMIAIKPDMSHLFEMNNAVSNGESLSIPGDRIFGSSRSLKCSLLGKEASLPLGPYLFAAQLNVPVLAINVMKESVKSYHILIKQLDAGSGTASERAQTLANGFAANLEEVVRRYPTQWFNYYDFWN